MGLGLYKLNFVALLEPLHMQQRNRRRLCLLDGTQQLLHLHQPPPMTPFHSLKSPGFNP